MPQHVTITSILIETHLVPAELLLLLVVRAERKRKRKKAQRVAKRGGKDRRVGVCVCLCWCYGESVSGQNERRGGKAEGGEVLLVSEN